MGSPRRRPRPRPWWLAAAVASLLLAAGGASGAPSEPATAGAGGDAGGGGDATASVADAPAPAAAAPPSPAPAPPLLHTGDRVACGADGCIVTTKECAAAGGAAAAVCPTATAAPLPPPPAHRQNFALARDGAKVVGTNLGARKADALLDDDGDTFLRNERSTSPQWVVLELAQVASLDTLELSQHELYSARVHEFEAFGRRSNPRLDSNGGGKAVDLGASLGSPPWESLGSFAATNVRGSQAFPVASGAWVKYLALRLLSYHGAEPVCALNELRAYGVSAVEDLEARLAVEGGEGGGDGEAAAAASPAEGPAPVGPEPGDAGGDAGNATAASGGDEPEPAPEPAVADSAANNDAPAPAPATASAAAPIAAPAATRSPAAKDAAADAALPSPAADAGASDGDAPPAAGDDAPAAPPADEPPPPTPAADARPAAVAAPPATPPSTAEPPPASAAKGATKGSTIYDLLVQEIKGLKVAQLEAARKVAALEAARAALAAEAAVLGDRVSILEGRPPRRRQKGALGNALARLQAAAGRGSRAAGAAAARAATGARASAAAAAAPLPPQPSPILAGAVVATSALAATAAVFGWRLRPRLPPRARSVTPASSAVHGDEGSPTKKKPWGLANGRLPFGANGRAPRDPGAQPAGSGTDSVPFE